MVFSVLQCGAVDIVVLAIICQIDIPERTGGCLFIVLIQQRIFSNAKNYTTSIAIRRTIVVANTDGRTIEKRMKLVIAIFFIVFITITSILVNAKATTVTIRSLA